MTLTPLQQIHEETNAAIKKGFDNAKVEWRRMALEILYNTCLLKETFTVNDFREQINKASVKTHDNRAMGGVMTTGKRFGWIRTTGNEITSRVGHLTPLQIWKSLVYGKGSFIDVPSPIVREFQAEYRARIAKPKVVEEANGQARLL